MALFSGVQAGIKKNKIEDFGLILPETKFPKIVGFFTSNKVRSEVIDRAEKILRKRKTASAIAIISGNAMCRYVGVEQDAQRICQAIADELKLKGLTNGNKNISPEDIVLLATGKIGEKLELKNVLSAVPKLVDSVERDYTRFSKAIMTTDKKPKVSEYKNGPIQIIGIAKGAGMIFPHFSQATTLSFIVANVRFEDDKEIFRILDQTIGAVNIDSCMSTNDSSIFIFDGDKSIPRSLRLEFVDGLKFVLSELAVKIAEDGEGVTRIVKVVVTGVQNYKVAKRISETVSSSMLFKSSIAGASPDFGRILAAVGSAGVSIGKINVYISNDFEIMGYDFSSTEKYESHKRIQVVKDTKIVAQNLDIAREIMKLPRYTIIIDVCLSKNKRVSAYTIMTDLTEEYVRFNKS